MRRSSPRGICRLIPASLVCLAALAGARADAQTFGAKGGLNLSNLVSDEFDTSAKASAVAGGFVRLPLFLGINLQAEGLIAQRRVTFAETVRDDLNYLEIPLLARRRIMTVGSRSVHVLGGAVVGARLSAKEVISGETVDVPDETYKKVDVGAAIGGEVAITRRWLVDVRYVFGMTNVFDVPGFEAKFRTLQVTAGFAF